jgi:hypothetical protein
MSQHVDGKLPVQLSLKRGTSSALKSHELRPTLISLLSGAAVPPSFAAKRGWMIRYHFHVFDGATYAWDAEGILLPDLTAVVIEAESRARSIMSTRTEIHAWTTWMIDVRGDDDITLFHYPFEEIAKAA